MKRLRTLLPITNQGKGGAQQVIYDHTLTFKSIYDVETAVFSEGQNQRVYDSRFPPQYRTNHRLRINLWPWDRLLSWAELCLGVPIHSPELQLYGSAAIKAQE